MGSSGARYGNETTLAGVRDCPCGSFVVHQEKDAHSWDRLKKTSICIASDPVSLVEHPNWGSQAHLDCFSSP